MFKKYNYHNHHGNTSNQEPKKSASENLADLDKFLEDEKLNNSIEPWSKLDKTAKLKKLTIFAETYKQTNNLSEEEHRLLITFFKDCLDKKKLHRVKDVVYNKETGEIANIPTLLFNKPANHFTLKNTDKHVSTVKGLTPKKKAVSGGTVKNANGNDSDNDE